MTRTECSCTDCKKSCQRVPGWFRPGEAEKAAELLNIPFQEFFNKYLGVNWYEDEDEVNTFVLAPATLSMEAGAEYPGVPFGVCVFYKDGKCSIHVAKPFECAMGNPCDMNMEEMRKERTETVELWKRDQGQINKLLKRHPCAEEMSLVAGMAMMFGGR